MYEHVCKEGTTRNIMNYINELMNALENVEIERNKPDDKFSYEEGMGHLVDFFIGTKKAGGNLYFIGNGGSAAVACHMTADFLKNGEMKTRSLYNPSTFSCFANDYGYEYVFSKQLEAATEKGDILVAISSSGNSQNIINAIEVVKQKGGVTISLTGFGRTNKARQISDYSIYVPSNEYGIVESIHNLILQQIVDEIKRKTYES